MRSMILWRKFEFAALMLVLILSISCSSHPDSKTLVMLIESSPTNLDPRVGLDGQSERIDNLIFDDLLDRDEHLNVKPGLADKWEIPDPLTYVFHLHPGVKFHNGAALTSRDVKWTFDSLLAGKIRSTKSAAYNRVDHIDAPDDLTVVFHMGLRTFYVPDASTQQELQDIVNVLRTVFEIKFVSSNTQKGTITVRAPINVLDPASRFLQGMGTSHPEVMLDVHVFEISKTLMHKFGLQIPNQFNLFNIPIGALGLTLAGGQSIQDAINQLIASGAINQGNSSALAGLLGQLLGGNASSILSQPLATFGNGITLFGVSLGTLTAEFSMNEGMLRSLEHVTLRAAQGKDATVNLGSRIPIINASFAPIFNTSAISQAIGNGSYIAPIPSFTYEDIGLNLKVKPSVHGTPRGPI